MRHHLGFGLNLLALGLFFPGIFLPMFNLSMDMAANLNNSQLVTNLVDKELSIIATVEELWRDDRLLVAALIFLFSVCIPLSKTIVVTLAYFRRHVAAGKRMLSWVAGMGKWSMADVFVVAIFLAVLSTNHAETTNTQQFSLFGFRLAFDVSTETLSAVGHGFYFFTGYCLLSLFGTHLAASAPIAQRPQGKMHANHG